MLRLLLSLVALGMYAGAFHLGRAVLRRHLRGPRRAIRAAPNPAWGSRLVEHVPLVRWLTAEERTRLLGKVDVFLRRTRIEGCGGLELTDLMRLVIAAQACLLTLGLADDPYEELETVLVYPTTFVPRRFEWVAGERGAGPDALLGEAWRYGVVILAWDSVRGGAANPFDGANVALHEFAHQLDMAADEADGIPVPTGVSTYTSWARVLTREYEALRRAAERGRPTTLDHYGATNPAEFFAVATEAFFEKPLKLRRNHPELYRELSSFYRQDPAARRETALGSEPHS